MLFKELCEVLQKIEQTASRNETTQILVELFSNLDEIEAQIVSYLVQGRLAPLFVNSEFNLSEKGLIKIGQTIADDWSVVKIDVKRRREVLGDIGLVFEEIAAGQIQESISQIYERLWDVVNISGTGSTPEKYRVFSNIVRNLSGIEAKYIVRIITGNLRLGASVKTLLDVFSTILNGDKKGRDELDRVYGSSADIGYIAKLVYLNSDFASLSVTPGIPVLSRLVERARSFEEVIERMQKKEFIVQPKFDGLRLQIHKSEKGFENIYKDRIWYVFLKKEPSQAEFFKSESTEEKVRLFTRNLEDVTKMFPEIVSFAQTLPSSFILDSEVVGWDYKKNRFMTYQDTMSRKRKYDISQAKKNIPVRAFTFDILYYNGKDLTGLNTFQRISLLNKVIEKNGKEIEIAESEGIQTQAELEEYFNKWVGMGLEGLIAKKREGEYTPGGRDFDWIKLKKSFMTELNDTLDLVVLGYYLGSGKRAAFGMGALLCGVLNERTEMFEGMCKVGTGITDLDWKNISSRLLPLVVDGKPKNVEVGKLLEPDVWVAPEVVITVEADQITKAINKGENPLAGGYSLRFPRMIEFDREKNLDEITKISELKSIN